MNRAAYVTMRSNEQRVFGSVNAVFEFDVDRRIVSWREYWDSGDIAAQFGVTVKAIHQRMLETF